MGRPPALQLSVPLALNAPGPRARRVADPRPIARMIGALACLLLGLAGIAEAGEVRIGGSVRARFEALEGQFRLGAGGSDQALALRTSLWARYRAGPLEATIEGLDARAYFTDDGSPVGNTVVNTRDVLQAWVGLRRDGDDASQQLRLGRMTLNLGSRRLVARNRFRNTINSFTGVHGWQERGPLRLEAFWFLPVLRRPVTSAATRDNAFAWDEQTTALQFRGVHGRWEQADWSLDGFLYDLAEDDAPDRPSFDRDEWTAGFRWRVPPRAGRLDGELEAVLQRGHRSASLAGDAPRLDHEASFVHAELGLRVAAGWLHRIALQYDRASGDDGPDDGTSGRFDTLSGARRFDFNPTGIYGPFARANLVSPGLRLELAPAEGLRLMAAVRHFRLASATDAWTTAGLRDRTGAAGDDLGTQLELRIRWDVEPAWRLEGGAAYLRAGDFPERLGSPIDRSLYGYGQVAVRF